MAEVLNQEQVLVNEDTLTTIADSVRLKLGEETNPNAVGFTKYTPMELANKIANEMPLAKDAIPNSAKHLSGNCAYLFTSGNWDWFIEQCGEEITTENINDCRYMFNGCKLERIPFIINLVVRVSGIDLSYIFYNSSIKEPPKIKGMPNNFSFMFSYCHQLRELPEDYFDDFDWSAVDATVNSYSCPQSFMFSECYSLRSAPPFDKIHYVKTHGQSYSFFSACFNNCICLDELVNVPLPQTIAWTINYFGSFFQGCGRLKKFTFALDNGQPYVKEWKKQLMDFTFIGYVQNNNYKPRILNYNSGITADKEVTDDATYQALKNNPDWFTCDVAYSRYNHDSAVETINSLPDTSAYLAANGDTNTIKFKGAAGSATDGGAINTLTEAEIAVAAAKGWTVSLV